MSKPSGKPRKHLSNREGPRCHCLLIADDISSTTARGKVNIHGVVGVIGVHELPAIIPNLCLFARITNVIGRQTVTVSMQDASEHRVIWEAQSLLDDANFPDDGPLAAHTIATRIPPFRVSEEGVYLVVVSHDGVPIAQAAIRVAGPRMQPQEDCDADQS